jgi:ubiquinone/menaquinone biosynthesis C-methylase UbiE
MFEDQAVEMIYRSHALEYFDRLEVTEALREWHRVLTPGGTRRLAVPDFEAMAAVYAATKDLNLVLGPLYGRWEPAPGVVIYHNPVYDFASLKLVLEANGFARVRRWDWREVFVGELQGYDDYSQAYIPHMDKENGRLISPNVQAVRE